MTTLNEIVLESTHRPALVRLRCRRVSSPHSRSALLFVYLQKYIVGGLTQDAVKG